MDEQAELRLNKEELLELRNALLQRENFRLQLQLAERDLGLVQQRLAEKYGQDAMIRTDTGLISRRTNGEISQQ